MTHPVDFPQEFPRWEMEHVGWRTQAGNIVTPVGHREADARLYGWEPVYRRIAGVTTGEPEQMRAEFEAWVQDCGCDTDGAWSAWQAAWNRRPSSLPHLASRSPTMEVKTDELRLVSNLSLLVARMARRLRRDGATVGDAGDRALADQAVDFLRRKGLTSPLRTGAAPEDEPVGHATKDDFHESLEAVGTVTSMVKGGVTWQTWPDQLRDGATLYANPAARKGAE